MPDNKTAKLEKQDNKRSAAIQRAEARREAAQARYKAALDDLPPEAVEILGGDAGFDVYRISIKKAEQGWRMSVSADGPHGDSVGFTDIAGPAEVWWGLVAIAERADWMPSKYPRQAKMF